MRFESRQATGRPVAKGKSVEMEATFIVVAKVCGVYRVGATEHRIRSEGHQVPSVCAARSIRE